LRKDRLGGLTARRVPEKKSESLRDSHWKDMSPLTHGLNYRSACDYGRHMVPKSYVLYRIVPLSMTLVFFTKMFGSNY